MSTGATADAPSLRSDVLTIGLVSVAHGLSHFMQLVLPPLFILMKDEFGLSYTALGSLSAITYAVSGVMQTPAGFAVDRYGGRAALLFGLAMISIAMLLSSLATGYWMLALAAVVAGLGNSVFHPADLALLNAKVNPKRLGYAFSVHGVSGNLGWVVAPLLSASIAALFGWRAALLTAGAIGLVYTALFATQRTLGQLRVRADQEPRSAGTSEGEGVQGMGLLVSTPILMSFAFFFVMAMSMMAYITFAATAFNQLYGLPLVAATGILTGFFVGGAVGTLAGGVIASRTERHDLVAVFGMLAGAIGTLLVATAALPVAFLSLVVAFVGFAIGAVSPSRDVLVRRIAPANARGKVYGFVYSGLDAGSALGPVLFGWMLDHDHVAWVFVAAAVLMIATLPTVFKMGLNRA